MKSISHVTYLIFLTISLLATQSLAAIPKSNDGDGNHNATPEIQALELKKLTKNIQVLLTKKGFDPGVPDGSTGAKTRKAICLYQYSEDLEVNPLPTKELEDHLSQSPSVIAIKKYTGIVETQCDVAHLNNVQNIEAVVNHSYEGALTASDYMCENVVSPFKITNNFKILFSGFSKNIVNIVKRKESDVRLDSLRQTAKQANWLPLNVEMVYGKALHEKRLKNGATILTRDSKRRDVKDLYTKGDEVLKRVLNSIEEKHPYQFNLFVVDDRTINAEAIPGGYIYVNSGVLKTDYADLVVAHEIAHVLRRHATRELQAALIDSVETLSDLKNLLSNKNRDPVTILEKALVLRGALVQYSQQQELQSDACSVRIVRDTQGANLNQQILAYISGIEKNLIKIKKSETTHPLYADRRARMLNVYEESSKQIIATEL